MTARPLLLRFPAPPQVVRESIDQLKASEGWAERDRAVLDPRTLDRPWDPASLPSRIRTQLWPWLDDVAGWVNHEYGWQTARTIPACWPQHPHLVYELAVLACLRVLAADATGPQPMEEWHRYVLPGFCERMAERIGGVGCPPGRHTEWPARSRHVEFTSPAAVDLRNQLFEADDASAEDTDSALPAAAPASTGRPPPPVERRAAASGQQPGLRAVPDPDPTEGDDR